MKKEKSSSSGAAEKPEEKKEPAHHVLEIVTNLINEKTGEKYIDLDSMKKILDIRKSIKKYAWIIHDKDVYVAEDIANAEASGKKEIPELGSPKAAHVHCVMYLNPAQTISTIAKWFNVKPQQIQLARYDSGEDFLAKVEYITHEDEKQQALGKHLYSDKYVHSSFDFRKELSERKENKEKYGTATPGKKLKNRIDVLSYGKSLREVADEDIIAYNDDMRTMLASIDTPIRKTTALMGHAEASTTDKYYVDFRKIDTTEDVKRLGEKMREISSKSTKNA